MWADPRTKAIWNRLGLTATNGVVILTMADFERALELARDQSSTTRETAEHAELKRLAEAATPGPWYRGHNENGCAQGEMSVWPDEKMTGAIIAQCGHQAPWAGWFEQPAKDAAFIAAANPATVLALLSEIAALRGERELTLSDGTMAHCSEDAWRWFEEWRARFEDDEAKRTQAERQRDELRKALEAVSELTDKDVSSRGLLGVVELLVEIQTTARAFLANQGADQCL